MSFGVLGAADANKKKREADTECQLRLTKNKEK